MEIKEEKIDSMVGNAPKRPYKEWRAGNIKVAVWKNKKETEDGGEFEFKTVSLTRSYRKPDEDIWRHDAINLRRNDIQKVIVVLQKAQEDLLLSNDSNEE